MQDDGKRAREADWAPGTLDRTRKAIGQLDPGEAEIMSKKLGGEVMYERSDGSSSSGKSSKGTGRLIRQTSSGNSENTSGSDAAASGQRGNGTRRRQEELATVTPKLSSLFDKLMMRDEYGIKPNYGLFNFIKYFQQNGHEQVVPEFCTVTLKHHVENLSGFITVIKTLIQIAPASYKAKIASGNEIKFKFLRMIAGWTMQSVKLAHIELMDLPQPYVVQDLIPYIRAVYKLLIQVYYYGENKIPKLIKEIYTDEVSYPESPQEKLSSLAKEAITSWLYIQNEIVKKCYPLLMRMCSDTFEEYPDFFKIKVADILKFVGLHKYDLLLPEKAKAVKTEDSEKKKKTALVPEKGVKDQIVMTGIKLLDQLFPQAGFTQLENHPDMYPYFQPLYHFADGFNVLSPENPMQVTVVLIRILEDFFVGCRNIDFKPVSTAVSEEKDSISSVMDDWSAYRENVFEKLYCDPLNDLVNQIYSQDDYEDSQFGKKLITSLLWQTQWHFLPKFKFDQLILERPQDESKYRPLFLRTDFARSYFTEAVSLCDKVASMRGDVSMISNPWDHYKFDISNEISKRLDTLLGGNNTTATTNANNANLLKYTLCILSVLDWWINNPESPAYSTNPRRIYRISEEDGKPKFSVPERNDQNKLFAAQIRAALTKKA
mgnify:FL=1